MKFNDNVAFYLRIVTVGVVSMCGAVNQCTDCHDVCIVTTFQCCNVSTVKNDVHKSQCTRDVTILQSTSKVLFFTSISSSVWGSRRLNMGQIEII